MSKKEVVENLEQAVRDNEERQRKEQMMASTLHKLNADDLMTDDDIDHVSKSGIVSVPKTISIPDSIMSTISPSKPSDSGSSESGEQAQQAPQEPNDTTSKGSRVIEAFSNQYWD